MTVKELKEKINNIDSRYDDKIIYVDELIPDGDFGQIREKKATDISYYEYRDMFIINFLHD